ncbi:hypothetical protein LWI29_010819 [Acer saccharum]|uniref:Uncharacterized protein n=1 Tax=Acer saccharum TaxID=4024 RepID=A0AA39W0W0_ACESA|nr:hypothetical protein LWI29_010819 [Acer saccharum]
MGKSRICIMNCTKIVLCPKKLTLENRSPNNIRLNEFVEVLREPKFHVLESEYHLSSNCHQQRRIGGQQLNS